MAIGQGQGYLANGVIYYMFIVQVTVITVVNYNCDMFLVRATVITIVIYNCDNFTVEVTGGNVIKPFEL